MNARDFAKILARQRECQRGRISSARERRALLVRLRDGLLVRREAILAALGNDLGKSPSEALFTEFLPVLAELRLARRRLGRWMRVRRAPTPFFLRPASSRIVPEPHGVAGIIAPWNYPFALALQPAVSALAAGCSVIIKPSETAPATSRVLAELVTSCLPAEYAVVIGGGIAEATLLAGAPLDCLFYTGSTRVGKIVMEKAAANLVPLTLELGGKSPVIVDRNFPLERAAAWIAWGKLLNAGQTCVAPDHVYVPAESVDAFRDAFRRAAASFYPTFRGNPDYGRIVNERHRKRLESLLDDARRKGASIERLESISPDRGLVMPPVLVCGLTAQMALMQEEIFGPILPILPYESSAELLATQSRLARPLAVYLFSNDRRLQEEVGRTLRAGSLTINATILALANLNLPFGGSGASGMGQYHGEAGFRAFSREKAFFVARAARPRRLGAAPWKAKALLRLVRFFR